MSTVKPENIATLELMPDGSTLQCHGNWTLHGVNGLTKRIAKLSIANQQAVTIFGEDIQDLDSVGGWVLQHLINQLKDAGHTVTLTGLLPAHQELLNLIGEHAVDIKVDAYSPPKRNFFYRVGQDSIAKFYQAMDLLEFIGVVAVSQLEAIIHPHKLKWRSVLAAIEEAGFDALPIVALLSFLIGIVLAYQMGVELRNYGADIFIVNVTGHAVLREFAPLITAIIAAGRTSSAYTAQLGTMKVNEEIDALTTMGLSPIEWLVLPKMIGALIAIPLLTVWADLFGILGSMFMAKLSLDINYMDFLIRFNDVVPMTTYMIGITKAPVFAAIIALTGCFQGFRVEYNARSVGQRTTISVVQAIFFLIVTDSLFSIYLNWAGI